jgi:hypothetical protein
MSIKNSEVWFRFLQQETVDGTASIQLQTENLTEKTFLQRIECLEKNQDEQRASLVFAAALVDEGAEGRAIRSGDPSISLIKLESSFRVLRSEFPSLPLLAMLKPESYRPRCQAWMLGEFLAERDLLLWADLRDLHPARMADWARNLSECGLASPRAMFQVTEKLKAEDLPALTETGVWLARPEMGNDPDRLVIQQV